MKVLNSVRRADLYSPPSSPEAEENAEVAALIELKFKEQFEYDVGTQDGAPSVTHQSRSVKQSDDINDETLEFRLFSGVSEKPSGSAASASIRKVLLKSPSPVSAEGGFVVPHRPLRYYIAANATADAKEGFLNAAISGEDVLKSAKSSRVRYVIVMTQLVRILTSKL
jgi:hypothetical protein